jgi:hypothetical protein
MAWIVKSRRFSALKTRLAPVDLNGNKNLDLVIGDGGSSTHTYDRRLGGGLSGQWER